MTNLLVIKKTAQLRTLTLLSFFLLLFSLTHCTSHPQRASQSKYAVSDEERIWLQEFFHTLLFEDPGAYVLFGTKPMSWSGLRDLPAEEEKTAWKAYYESLPPDEKAKYFKKKEYDFKGHFKKWEQIKHRFPIHQYLFGRFPNAVDEKIENLFFVNIEQAVRVLLESYADFQRVLGYDFDPLEAVFDIENRDSKFWIDVQQHHVLLGILLGFERDNAWLFDWEMKYKENQDARGNFFRSLQHRFSEKDDFTIGNCVIDPTPRHFQLPIFGSYGRYPKDETLIAKYKQEQRKIKALYKGRDEVDVALEWLTR